jgi:hypothetical protein
MMGSAVRGLRGQGWQPLEPTDDEYTFPPLRYSEVACAEQPTPHGVAKLVEVCEQPSEESCVSESEDSSDVLNDYERGMQLASHPQDLAQERIARVVSITEPSYGKALAGWPCDKSLQCGHAEQVPDSASVKTDDIAGEDGSVGLVDLKRSARVAVELDGQCNTESGLPEAKAEATGAGEQINNARTGPIYRRRAVRRSSHSHRISSGRRICILSG